MDWCQCQWEYLPPVYSCKRIPLILQSNFIKFSMKIWHGRCCIWSGVKQDHWSMGNVFVAARSWNIFFDARDLVVGTRPDIKEKHQRLGLFIGRIIWSMTRPRPVVPCGQKRHYLHDTGAGKCPRERLVTNPFLYIFAKLWTGKNVRLDKEHRWRAGKKRWTTQHEQ